MNAFAAIVRLTCRSAVRSHIFRTLLVFLLLAVLLIPLLVKHDGTALGMAQITLEYSFGLISVILCLSAVWLSCSEITSDVADSRLQLITVKPVGRITIFFAKFSGVLLLHAVLLLISAAAVYLLFQYRISKYEFAEGERERVEKEVLAGRRVFKPDQPDLDRLVSEKLSADLAAAEARGEEMPESWLSVRNKAGEFDRAEVIRRMKETFRNKEDSIGFGAMKRWTYRGLPEDFNGPFRVRYKILSGDGQTLQGSSFGTWGWRFHFTPPGSPSGVEPVPKDGLLFPGPVTTMLTSEFELPRMDQEGVRMTRGDGTGTLIFQNLDPHRKTLLFRGMDGPFLLYPETGFFRNYLRAVLVVFLEITAFSLLAVSFGACFTLPSGIFLTFSYLLLCLSSRFVLDIYTQSVIKPHSVWEWAGLEASRGLEHFLIDLPSFSVAGFLSSGELIEWSFIGQLFAGNVLLRGLPFLAAGLWVYAARELAIAARER